MHENVKPGWDKWWISWQRVPQLPRPTIDASLGQKLQKAIKAKWYGMLNRGIQNHYENTPIQIYRKFHLKKLIFFR